MKRLLLIAMLALAACAPVNTDDWPQTDMERISSGVYRMVDTEAGVVCWVLYDNGPRSGIDCLPITETRLDQ